MTADTSVVIDEITTPIEDQSVMVDLDTFGMMRGVSVYDVISMLRRADGLTNTSCCFLYYGFIRQKEARSDCQTDEA